MLALGGAMLADLAIVVLGPSRQCVAEIMAQPVGIQFVDRAKAVVAQDRLQHLVSQKELVATVQVEIKNARFAGRRFVEQGLQFDDRVPYRPAQVRQIEAAEQSVPVRIVGLCQVQQFAHAGCRLCAEIGDAHGKLLHALVHPVRLGIPRHEVAPDAAAHKGFGLLVAMLVLFPFDQFGIALRAVGIQRPFVHLDVGGGRQVNHPTGAMVAVEIAIKRGLDRRRGEHAFDELLQPLLFINPLVGLRPDAQFFDVVEVDRCRRTLFGGQRFEVMDRFGCGGKRNAIAQRFRDREQVESAAAFLRREKTGQFPDPPARAQEVIVVDRDVANAGIGERGCHGRLPDPFREPGAARSPAERSLQAARQGGKLRTAVAFRDRCQHRLCVAAAEHFDLAAHHHLAQFCHVVGKSPEQIVEQPSAEVC